MPLKAPRIARVHNVAKLIFSWETPQKTGFFCEKRDENPFPQGSNPPLPTKNKTLTFRQGLIFGVGRGGRQKADVNRWFVRGDKRSKVVFLFRFFADDALPRVSFFDVSGKRSPDIHDLIDNHLNINGFNELPQLYETVNQWKINCQERIQKSKLKKLRTQQFNKSIVSFKRPAKINDNNIKRTPFRKKSV